jgi:hypothetical protein
MQVGWLWRRGPWRRWLARRKSSPVAPLVAGYMLLLVSVGRLAGEAGWSSFTGLWRPDGSAGRRRPRPRLIPQYHVSSIAATNRQLPITRYGSGLMAKTRRFGLWTQGHTQAWRSHVFFPLMNDKRRKDMREGETNCSIAMCVRDMIIWRQVLPDSMKRARRGWLWLGRAFVGIHWLGCGQAPPLSAMSRNGQVGHGCFRYIHAPRPSLQPAAYAGYPDHARSCNSTVDCGRVRSIQPWPITVPWSIRTHCCLARHVYIQISTKHIRFDLFRSGGHGYKINCHRCPICFNCG